jgi:hypothetical protein
MVPLLDFGGMMEALGAIPSCTAEKPVLWRSSELFLGKD